MMIILYQFIVYIFTIIVNIVLGDDDDDDDDARVHIDLTSIVELR